MAHCWIWIINTFLIGKTFAGAFKGVIVKFRIYPMGTGRSYKEEREVELYKIGLLTLIISPTASINA